MTTVSIPHISVWPEVVDQGLLIDNLSVVRFDGACLCVMYAVQWLGVP